jgi:hypothetical protein
VTAELLPPTAPEVRRLLWRLVWSRPPQPDHTLRWSVWRRRHQARAKRGHYRRRLARLGNHVRPWY